MFKKKVVKKKRRVDYVVVKSKTYGRALLGTKIYFEGKRPKRFKKDGSIRFGKNILEILNDRFKNAKYRWVITIDEDSIKLERVSIECAHHYNYWIEWMGNSTTEIEI